MSPRIPSFRSTLLGLHDVIFRISDMRWTFSGDVRLTLIEEAVLVLEDHRFLKHRGYDWVSIIREALRAFTGRRFGGASTIDVQLFRTISNRYERTMRRKIREFVGAYALQKKFSKIEMLRCYLECAYFGTGIIGAEAGAYEVFGKSKDELDLQESLFIAAMLVYPKPRVASVNWQAKVSRRANYGGLVFSSRKKSLYQL